MTIVATLLAACALGAGGVSLTALAAQSATPNTVPPLPAAAEPTPTEPPADPFAGIPAGETVLRGPDGAAEATYRYRLVEPRPEAIADPGARVPLVVFLHGSGERGSDNRAQLVHFAGSCGTDRFQRRAPCYVLAMQCPAGEVWSPIDLKAMREKGEPPKRAAEPTRAMRALMQAIDEVLASKAVDPSRVYLTGLSMGGFGSFDLASRRPELFAAVVPICGGGDPSTAPTLACVPFFIVHGSDDPVVPVELSRLMREAIAVAAADAARADRGTSPRGTSPRGTSPRDPSLRERPMQDEPVDAAGAPVPIPKRTPNPEYREYDRVGHDSWTPAYRFGPDGVLDWMFAQRRGG